MDFLIGIAIYIMCSLYWYLFYSAILVILSDSERKIFSEPSLKHSIAVSAVSATHGLLASTVGAVVVYYCYTDVIKAEHPFAHWFAWVSMAYFTYDIWAMYQVQFVEGRLTDSSLLKRLLQYWSNDPVMVSHHSVTALVLLPVLIYRRGIGDFFVGCFYCLEFSALFTNARKCLSKCGLKSSRLYTINGIFMVVTFALCRVLVFPFMYWCYGTQYGKSASYHSGVGALDAVIGPVVTAVKSVPSHCTLGSTLVLLPQLYWFTLMLRTCCKMLFVNSPVKQRHSKKES